MIKFKDFLLETNNEELTLKRYLSLSKDEHIKYLIYDFEYMLQDFIDDVGLDIDDLDVNDLDVDDLDDDVKDDFSKWIYSKIENNEDIPNADIPSWVFFDDNPKILKPQWLLHFSDNAYSISKDGFKYGISEMSKLGLTTQQSEYDKKWGGYNFAYLVDDSNKYSNNRDGYKYGKEAILFISSGVLTYHYSDEEPQVIFWGEFARNIIYIEKINYGYGIASLKDGNIIFEADTIEEVAYWAINNFNQYRKSIVSKEK